MDHAINGNAINANFKHCISKMVYAINGNAVNANTTNVNSRTNSLIVGNWTCHIYTFGYSMFVMFKVFNVFKSSNTLQNRIYLRTNYFHTKLILNIHIKNNSTSLIVIVKNNLNACCRTNSILNLYTMWEEVEDYLESITSNP